MWGRLSVSNYYFFLDCIVKGDKGDASGVLRGNEKEAFEVLLNLLSIGYRLQACSDTENKLHYVHFLANWLKYFTTIFRKIVRALCDSCCVTVCCVTHFWPLFLFYTPWKPQKIFGFLVFSGGYKMRTLVKKESNT